VRALALPSSIVVITIVLWDAFETVVLPRTVSRRLRLTRLDFRVTWLTCCRSATLLRAEVRREGVSIETDRHPLQLRRSDAPSISAMARSFMMPVPSSSHRQSLKDNWQTSPRGAAEAQL
jgi:hypothetical protein